MLPLRRFLRSRFMGHVLDVLTLLLIVVMFMAPFYQDHLLTLIQMIFS